MKKVILVIISVLVILVMGCEPTLTGKVVADLEKDTIKDGESTYVKVSATNTGSLPGGYILRVLPEDSSQLNVSYPGSLEFYLQAGEDTGTRNIKVVGHTKYTSTKYSLKAQLVNKQTGEVLNEEELWLTVNKR